MGHRQQHRRRERRRHRQIGHRDVAVGQPTRRGRQNTRRQRGSLLAEFAPQDVEEENEERDTHDRDRQPWCELVAEP